MSHPDDDPREDGGVLLCGKPECPVCWMLAPITPELLARIRSVNQMSLPIRFRLEEYQYR